MAKRKKKLSKYEVEKLSKNNAKKIVQGRDTLKSWGNSGWFKSKKLNKWFQYRSSLELGVLHELEDDDNVLDWDTEAFYIPYQMYESGTAATLNYVPDFILKTNKKTFVIEVKPSNKLSDPKNKAKFSAAKTWCWEKGVRFIVITEKESGNLSKILSFLQNKDINSAQSLMEWSI